MNAETYPFELTLDELYWLAGAFGISSLPLPDAAFDGLTPEQLAHRQKTGHASLLTRGLLRPSPGFGWQVEQLPAALLQWISSAPSLLRLERIPREGPSRSLHLFTADAQGLSLEMDGDTARFVIFSSRRLLQDSALRWLSLPAKAKKSAIVHELPQPLTFLPAAWKDPSLAARILREHGLEASALEWAASLEWVAALSRVKLDGARNTLAGQFALCGDGKSIWGGREDERKVPFISITKAAINATIGEML